MYEIFQRENLETIKNNYQDALGNRVNINKLLGNTDKVEGIPIINCQVNDFWDVITLHQK